MTLSHLASSALGRREATNTQGLNQKSEIYQIASRRTPQQLEIEISALRERPSGLLYPISQVLRARWRTLQPLLELEDLKWVYQVVKLGER